MRVLLYSLGTLAILIGLYYAMLNAIALAAAEQQLVEFDRRMWAARQEISQRVADVQKIVSDTIPEAIEGHTRMLQTMARQYRPGSEWTATAVNVQTLQYAYGQTFASFVNNASNREAFPELAASAYYRLGQLQFLSGNNADALRSLNESTKLATALNDPLSAGLAFNTRGCVHAALGDHELALDDFQQCLSRLSESRDHVVPAALALRNMGLIQRSLGTDGIPSMGRAVKLLSGVVSDVKFSYANELLIDTRMALCEMHWAQGEFEPALEQCRRSQQELALLIELTKDFGKQGAARSRYINANRLIEHNLAQLASARNEGQGAIASTQSLQDAGGWRWQPLFDLTTELVSTDLSMVSVMTSEFDHQNGLLLAWGMYDWTKQVVVEIAKHGWDRCPLVIVADNGESLREARGALEEAGVPVSKISFRVSAHEASWFRDGGPIVGKSRSGHAVWFDSTLTRHDLPSRLVTDALPSLNSSDWQARVARTSIHIEGGMLLSNGRGLTLCARPLLEINRRYGFTDDFVEQELKRVTGAKELVFVDAMVGEPTGHLDMFMTFVDPDTVVVGQFLDAQESNATLLDGIADSLSQVVMEGRELNVVRIPMPPRREGAFAGTNTGTFQSFTNVVYVNGLLLVPSYSGEAEKHEQAVREIYARLLPEWEIEFIDCSRTSLFGGALHCLVSNLGDTPRLESPEY